MTVNGNVSFWFAADGLPGQRTLLTGGTTADVAIVGAGYTGLWTAYYVKKADPSLDIVVLEGRFAGFGAPGRNGGWLTMDSSMIATEPLPDPAWEELGWSDRERSGHGRGHGPRLHAWPAHRGRAHCPGRARGAVPVRFQDRRRRGHPTRHHQASGQHPARHVSRHPRCGHRPRLGRGARCSPGTGRPPAGWIPAAN